MSDAAKTGAYLIAAVVSVVLVVVSTPGSSTETVFQDEGTVFFPAFTSPEQAKALDVIEVDAGTVTQNQFNVVVGEDGLWRIPSRDNYPADAEQRMAGAAALFIGLKRGRTVSETKADHARLGVLHPTDPEAPVEGRGTLVTFKDGDGKELGSLILGKTVDGVTGQRYVREPKKMRTYTAEMEAEISADFADWIETDLLGLSSSWDIQSITFHGYSVDEVEGTLKDLEKKTTVEKSDLGEWTVVGAALDEEANGEVLEKVTSTLDELRIVDVEPKPEGLDERLRVAQGIEGAILRQALQRRGFFLADLGNGLETFSNMGDLIYRTEEGVKVTLRFGEVDAMATGGSEAEDGADPAEPKGANRYLMVTATFDETALPRPDGPEMTEGEAEERKAAVSELERLVTRVEGWKAMHDDALPESLGEMFDEDDAERDELLTDPWERAYLLIPRGEGAFTVRCLAADGTTGGENAAADIDSDAIEAENARLDAADAVRKWKEKAGRGRTKARELSERFGRWYYVIDAKSFEALHLSREDIVRKRADSAGGDDGDDGDDGGGGDDEEEGDGGGDDEEDGGGDDDEGDGGR